MRLPILVACLSILTLAPGTPAQEVPGADRPKVIILGASLSGGFNAAAYDGRQANLFGLVDPNLKLEGIANAWWPEGSVELVDVSSVAVFAAPRSGTRQLRRAHRLKPDLVLAVDFPFWYGYGKPPRRMSGNEEARWRFARQTELLEALDAIDAPMIIGDYPDLTNADRRMIPEALIPSRAVIRTLDSRLHAWAAQRPRVRLVPLASLLRGLVAGRFLIDVDGTRSVQADPRWVLQWDRMHPTRLGMACFGQWLQDELSGVQPPIRKLDFERLTTITGATEEFRLLQAGQEPPKSRVPRIGGRR